MHVRSLILGLSLSASLAFAPAMAAQGGAEGQAAAPRPDPGRFLPQQALLQIECDGPARMAELFRETRVAQLLQSEELRETLLPFAQSFWEQWRGTAQQIGISSQGLLRFAKRYDGRMAIAVGAQPQGLLGGGSADAWALVALSPGEGLDFASVQRVVRGFLEANEATRSVRQLGQQELVFRRMQELEFLLPVVLEGCLVFAVAQDADSLVAAMRKAMSRATEAKPKLGGPKEGASRAPAVFELRAPMAPWWNMMEQQLRAPGGAADPETALLRELLERSKLTAWTEFGMRVQPRGEFAELGFVMPNLRKAGGAWPLILPGPEPFALARYVPRDLDAWQLSQLDLAGMLQLYFEADAAVQGVGKGEGESEGERPAQGAGARAQFDRIVAQATGLRLQEDLLDLLGGEFLQLGQASVTSSGSGPTGLGGLCYALELRDHARFGASLEKLLRKRGMHAARREIETEHGSYFRLPVLGLFDVSYAIRPGMLIAGLGDEGAALIERALAAPARQDVPRPAAIAARLAALGEGQQLGGSLPIGGLLRVLEEQVRAEAGAGAGAEIQLVLDLTQRARRLLEKHGLAHLVFAHEWDHGSLHYRMIW
jgi:hypothetical protein